jgi:Cellulose binding domain/Fibronectin type III domain
MPGKRKRLSIAAATLLAAALLGVIDAHPAGAATLSASVTVNATAGLGTVPAHAIGLNTAVYDGDMNDTAIAPLLKAAGIDAMRYPGGSYSDIYNWQTDTAVDSGYVAPNTSFSSFMTTANAAGAQPIITVNYGTGTPSLAAAWVTAAASDSVGYWEVGNEVYGNGTYGANWEADAHCDTSLNGSPVTIGSEPSQTYNCGPTQYAANVLQFESSMHAANSNAKVCAILTTPGFWPDGVTNSEYPQPWNQTVLTALGSQTQCVVVHYYPGGSTTAGMLTDPTDIAGIVSTLHSEISQYAGIANAASIPILVTETNSSIDMDTQPAALFGADMYMTWLENGVTNVDWWNEHNGEGTVSTVDGATDYGDQGIFSNASNSGGTTEPAVDTPFAPYYGIEMLSKLAAPGATMVTSTSAQALVRVHAVRDTSGNLNVLIDNEDPSNSYTVSLTENGFTPSGTPTVYTLANNGTSITSASGSAGSVTVAPYTLTVVHIPGSGGTGVTAPGSPGQPVASGLSSSTSSSTSGTATLTWPAATAGTYPIADYQVYQVTSSGSTLVTTTTGTSVTLTGLTIGASYTYNVVTVDSHSNASLPSPPVTFTVPPPAGASCAVHYSVAGSWPGGFQGGVTITDKASTAVNGWTLTWTWPPSTGEVITQMWNASYTQTGANVSAVNASYDATIGANGGTVTFGFLGNDSGQTTAPAAFYLNGSICSND